jgi:hypothetical protein
LNINHIPLTKPIKTPEADAIKGPRIRIATAIKRQASLKNCGSSTRCSTNIGNIPANVIKTFAMTTPITEPIVPPIRYGDDECHDLINVLNMIKEIIKSKNKQKTGMIIKYGMVFLFE